MDNIHYNQMMIDGNLKDWREKTLDLIGEEPVEFRITNTEQLHSSKHSNPIVQIWSEDKSALDRVLVKAIGQ